MTGRLGLSIVASIFLAVVSTTPVAAAGFQETAANFMQNLGERVLASAAPGSNVNGNAAELIGGFVDEGLDMSLIGRFTLGRYWSQASTEERAEFTKLLRARITQLLLSQIKRFGGGDFQIDRVVEISTNREDVVDALVVSRVTRPDGEGQEVLWRIRRAAGGPKIIDVVMEGISMIATQRDEFATVIRRHGGNIAALIAQMRAKTKS